MCQVPGYTRIKGFRLTNDLGRHTKRKHPLVTIPTEKYRCFFTGYKSKKLWPRLDYFHSHLKRVYGVIVRNDNPLMQR
jgi:hypothetical protein